MSGIQFSSPVTNQKASPAVYASSLATRPAPQLPGRIFVDTDDPSTGMYRDTGSVWVQLSSGSGTVPDLQTVCNVGFLTDTDMTFLYTNSADTSKIGFLNQAVGDFAFDILKKANELFSIRALKPSTVNEEMEIIFDAPDNTIKTSFNSIDIGLKLDFDNDEFSLRSSSNGYIKIDNSTFNVAVGNFDQCIFAFNAYDVIIGDVTNAGSGTNFNVLNTGLIKTNYAGIDNGLLLDFANRNFYFGNDWQEATNEFGWFGMTPYDGSQQWNIKIKDTVTFNATFTQNYNSEEGFNQGVSSGTDISNFSQNAVQLYNTISSTTYNSYVQLLNESFYVSITNNSTSGATFLFLDGANQRLELSNNLKSATAGGNSGQHLKIRVGGTDYKIQLLNP
jgi:hypothetical protein